jgi:hypothetical protein
MGTCHQCGQEFELDEFEVARHVTESGEIDYDADADHIPYELSEDEDDDDERGDYQESWTPSDD